MTQRAFGTGNLYALPLGGGAPIALGSINAASVDFDGDVKMLYGQNQFPDDVAVGKRKITGKATVGLIDVNLANALFFGQTVSGGQTLTALSEGGVVPASSPYTYTAQNAATFKTDLGVYYASTGVQLVQVATGPTVGQYSVSGAGVYTFAAADTGKALVLVYDYGITTSGSTLAINQQLMGTLPTFQLKLRNNFKGKSMGIDLYSCVSSKFSLPFKQDDYLIEEFDFSAYANAAGQVGAIFNG
jgi:hypothetical protein